MKKFAAIKATNGTTNNIIPKPKTCSSLCKKAIRKKDGEKLHSFFSRTRLIRKKIIDAGQS